MRKYAILAGLMLLAGTVAQAAVTVDTQATSLVTASMTAAASSSPIALFKFALTADDSETLSSVTVRVDNNGSSTAAAADLGTLAVYKDDGDGNFETNGDDMSAGSEASVNIGSDTTVNTAANNTLVSGGTFFVTLTTSASWGGVTPVDSIKVKMEKDAVVTSANSPEFSDSVETAAISSASVAQTPDLSTAVASNAGNNSGIGAGDKVTLTFSSATNKPSIIASNIDDVLGLDNSHVWVDGDGQIGSASWSSDGKVLTVTLSAGTSAPTVAVGDKVTVSGTTIKDSTETHNATGDATISGNFSGSNDNQGDDEGDDEDNDEGEGHNCTNTLINGRLYKVADSPTVYLASHCILKPFRGAAVFHARGHKFQNIITLSSLSGFTVSDKPALPAIGTLVKGSDSTVWFVETGHKRKGFASAAAFLGLGFNWNQINAISDDDLHTMDVDSDIIKDATHHPNGTLVKCTTSPTVGQVEGNTIVPFANAESFELRGHTFAQIATVNCSVYKYVPSAPITQ